MFVRTQALLALSVASLGVACSDPDLPSDLRPDGPPEVLAVLVNNDPTGVLETCTFCKVQGPNDEQGAAGSDAGDPKRPGQVDDPLGQGTTQLCPADLTMGVPEVEDAVPTAWYVRVMFDELLNDDVEDLIPILNSDGTPSGNFSGSLLNTQPVTLSCGGVAVPYDGYYQPSGNAFTWPVGPSLFVAPIDPTTVPTSTECTITIKANVCVDKDNNPVPADQVGPYKFGIAQLAITAVVPTAGVTDSTRDSIDPSTPIELTFNDVIDPSSITASDVQLFKGVGSDCTGGTQVPDAKVGFFQQGDGSGNVVDPTSIEIYDETATPPVNPDPSDPTQTGNLFDPNSTYRLVFTATASATDAAGGSAALAFPADGSGNAVTELCFDTMAAD